MDPHNVQSMLDGTPANETSSVTDVPAKKRRKAPKGDIVRAIHHPSLAARRQVKRGHDDISGPDDNHLSNKKARVHGVQDPLADKPLDTADRRRRNGDYADIIHDRNTESDVSEASQDSAQLASRLTRNLSHELDDSPYPGNTSDDDLGKVSLDPQPRSEPDIFGESLRHTEATNGLRTPPPSGRKSRSIVTSAVVPEYPGDNNDSELEIVNDQSPPQEPGDEGPVLEKLQLIVRRTENGTFYSLTGEYSDGIEEITAEIVTDVMRRVVE